MEDFKQLEFHNLQQSQSENKYAGSEFEGLEGISCLYCKEKCPGLCQHSWRRGCGNCKCPLWKHDVPQSSVEHPFNRMCVEEKLPPLNTEYDKALTEGYVWVPRGLRSSQIDVFMRKLPKPEIPKVGSVGSKYRARQILYQLPQQDFNIKYAKFSTAIPSFSELARVRVSDSLGIGGVRGAISSATHCASCSGNINPGDIAVFSERIGDKQCWHPQCFKCCVDDTFLVDLIHGVRNNKLYCMRHWSEQIKPRCHGCEELIYIGEFTKAMDQSWHVEHFCCWECDVPLTGKKYIIVSNHPYCQRCYNNSMANSCHHCGEPIGPESKDLFVKDRHYHKDCLYCSLCKKHLESQTFSFVNEEAVCHKCRGVDPEKSQYCKGCGSAFLVEEKKVGVSNEYYHERCFLCSECQKPIGSQKFIRKNDGRRLCNDCFLASAKSCYKCGDLIKGSTVRFEGNPYHTECLLCTNCKKQLGGIQFYKHEDSLFCEDCYLTTHAKRCAACYEPVEGNTKFIDYDAKYWHSKCFLCTGCEKQLSGTKFVVRDGNRFCLDCK